MTSARAWFVTGTDTGVGKTLTTAALIHLARRGGLSALGMKPVAAGAQRINGEWANEDAILLRNAGSFDPGLALINPYCMAAPIAPHLAAAEEGVRIDRQRLHAGFETLSTMCECLFVEGVGGFCVPLGPDYDSADLACDLGLPVILVVGMRLGCINHALLSADAILGRGLRLAGWVANRIDPGMLRADENIDTLRSRLPAPLLGTLPHASVGDPAELADYLTLPQ